MARRSIEILGKRINEQYFYGAMLVIFTAAYVITSNAIIGVIALASLAMLFLSDVLPQKWSMESIRSSVWELFIAFLAAFLFWNFLTVALQTSTPVDVVTSCSMLPTLQRGDLVVVQGGNIAAKEITISRNETPISLIKEACSITDKKTGRILKVLCTSGAQTENGEIIKFDKSGDTIVFEPGERSPYGLIIHRAVLRLKTPNGIAYVTKGDNNQRTDIEGIGAPIPERNVRGKMLFRIPYIGYLKLLLALQFEEPGGCSQVVQYENQ